MAAFLIAGLPGSDKSTVLAELSARGYATLDADQAEGLSQWRHRVTGALTRHRDPDAADWNEQYAWFWDVARAQELATNTPADPFFVGGNAANIAECYRFFDTVFALILSDHDLAVRLQTRSSRYGSEPEELHKIMEWNTEFAANEQRRGATLIDASRPVELVVGSILEQLS